LEDLSIKVNIAGRTFPLTVKSDDEELVRTAAKLVNDKLKELQDQFAVKDNQDILSMICLEYVVEFLRLKSNNEMNSKQLTDQLTRIKAMLDRANP